MRIPAFKKIIKLISILITLIVLTNFVIITTHVYEYKNNTFNVEEVSNEAFSQKVNDKDVIIIFSDNSVKVKDCHELSKEEQVQVASFIVTYLESNDIYYDRTINNLVAEISLHSYLYKLGISKASTIDADLEYVEDSRWYVRTGTIIFQFFGV